MPAEIDRLRAIEQVVRSGAVRRIGPDRVTLTGGDIPGRAGEVYVDCTATGLRPTVPIPVFGDDRITLQYVTLGIVPWGAAIIGVVEALRDDIAEKNRLCPTVPFTGRASDLLAAGYASMLGITARSGEPDIAGWNDQCRLNPAMAAAQHAGDPAIVEAFTTILTHAGPALENLTRRAGTLAPAS
jgi:hypothetical protein